eukprot:Seg2082.3 transcript_id=Seg2082.3/GoldUCD/mRNA.D3Y31 product="hypothetical protein" protein_id=Seg2082.3/GoldUCD/D3Y31
MDSKGIFICLMLAFAVCATAAPAHDVEERAKRDLCGKNGAPCADGDYWKEVLPLGFFISKKHHAAGEDDAPAKKKHRRGKKLGPLSRQYQRQHRGSGFGRQYGGSGFGRQYGGSGFGRQYGGSGFGRQYGGSGFGRQYGGSGFGSG